MDARAASVGDAVRVELSRQRRRRNEMGRDAFVTATLRSHADNNNYRGFPTGQLKAFSCLQGKL
jgi:hypothetical protein